MDPYQTSIRNFGPATPNMQAKALAFATQAHFGQARKYLDEPYIEHPIRVSRLVSNANYGTDNVMAAALLHDVIEDCGVTEAKLQQEGFSDRTVKLVVLLSKWWADDAAHDYIQHQKRTYYSRIVEDPEAVVIKMADRIDNLHDFARIASEHKNWARNYYRKTVEEFGRITDVNPSRILQTAFTDALVRLDDALHSS